MATVPPPGRGADDLTADVDAWEELSSLQVRGPTKLVMILSPRDQVNTLRHMPIRLGCHKAVHRDNQGQPPHSEPDTADGTPSSVVSLANVSSSCRRCQAV